MVLQTSLSASELTENSQIMTRAKDSFSKMQEQLSSKAQYDFFFKGVELLYQVSGKLQSLEAKKCFIQLSIDAFKHMCSISEQNHLMIDVSLVANQTAISIGDYRSAAICNFQLSSLLLAFNKLDESKEAYKKGFDIVQQLGDSEIYDTAALHRLAYHTLRGHPQKALKISNQVYQSLHHDTVDPFVISFAIPVIALAAAFTGRFRLGVRLLVGGRQAAQTAGAKSLDLALQAQLGLLLAASGDLIQARHHINAGLEAPKEMHLPLSRFWIERNNAYLLYAEGNLKASYEQMQIAQRLAAGSDGVLFYHAPWLLEMIYAFHSEGLEPIEGFQYESEIQSILDGPNLHLKGTAYRLMALEASKNALPPENILALLSRSKEYLLKIGGKMELAKTLVEIGRTYIRNDEIKKARPSISEAWNIYSHTAPNLFPGNLHLILTEKPPVPGKVSFWPGHKNLMNLLDNLDFSVPGVELYQQLVSNLSTFWGAERAILLKNLIRGEKSQTEVIYCLERLDTNSPETQWIFSLAERSMKDKKPIIEDLSNDEGNRISLLCIPFRAIKQNYIVCIGTSYRHLIQKFSESEILNLASHVGLQLSFIVNKFMSLEKTHKEKIGLLTTGNRSIGNEFIFSSEAMHKLTDNAKTAARLDVPILVLGETGAGKEVIAKYIHEESKRSHMPFVTIDLNCTSESLIESELFGHQKGAFTGAEKQRIGCIELANEGTLFIDEIGEIPLSVQTKLLRVIQEKTFKRLGSTRTHTSNFRLIAATNRNLQQDIKNKKFREDLYHRLNVVPLLLPPLRERQEDIISLAEHFLENFSRKHDLPILELNFSLKMYLKSHSWPGNIRELKNLMERVIVLQDTTLISNVLKDQNETITDMIPVNNPNIPLLDNSDRTMTLDEIQAAYIKYILEKTHGKIGGAGGAAKILGINRSTLYNRMKKLGVTPTNNDISK